MYIILLLRSFDIVSLCSYFHFASEVLTEIRLWKQEALFSKESADRGATAYESLWFRASRPRK